MDAMKINEEYLTFTFTFGEDIWAVVSFGPVHSHEIK